LREWCFEPQLLSLLKVIYGTPLENILDLKHFQTINYRIIAPGTLPERNESLLQSLASWENHGTMEQQ
jgi:hypothetical protein